MNINTIILFLVLIVLVIGIIFVYININNINNEENEMSETSEETEPQQEEIINNEPITQTMTEPLDTSIPTVDTFPISNVNAVLPSTTQTTNPAGVNSNINVTPTNFTTQEVTSTSTPTAGTLIEEFSRTPNYTRNYR